tara:strand:+ start:981 stop:1193 length:213 start_codon:yes stop_codon:yes gene_type:complete
MQMIFEAQCKKKKWLSQIGLNRSNISVILGEQNSINGALLHFLFSLFSFDLGPMCEWCASALVMGSAKRT